MAQESVSFLISAVDGVTQVVNRIHANLNQRFGGMVQSVAKFQQSMQKAANLSMAAQGVQDFGNRVMDAVKGPVEKAMEFESAMADVSKVVTFETPEGFKEFSKQLQDLSANKIPITADGLANIAAAGGQLGIAQKDLLGFTQIAAKMSVAYDMMAGEAGDNMAKLMNIFELPLSGVERLGDAINHLSDSTAAKARDIVNAMGRIGGMAKQFGLAETQAAALADAFIALGKPPEVAATAINAMLNKLQNSDKQNDKFIQALEDMGYSAKEMKDNIKEDAQGALFDFLKTLENYDKETRAGFLVDLFGLEYSDDISLLAGSLGNYSKALAVLGEQTGVEDMLRRVWELPIEDKIAKLQELGLDVDTAKAVAGMRNLAQATEAVRKEMDYAGSMQREFENRSATTANAMQLFQNKVSNFGITIGSILLPALNNLMDKFGGIVTGIAAWAEAHPALTSFIVQTVAAVGALSIALAVLMKGTAAIIAGSAAIRLGFAGIVSAAGYIGRALQVVALFGSVAGMKIMNFARMVPIFFGALANPAFLAAFLAIGVPIIAAVGAIAASAYLIYRNWEGVKTFFVGLWQGIGEAFAPAWESIKSLWEMSGLSAIFTPLISALGQLWNWFTALFAPVQETEASLQAWGESGRGVGEIIGTVLGAAVKLLLIPLQGLALLLGEGIKLLVSLGQWLGETAAKVVLFVQNFSLMDTIKAMFQGIWDWLMSFSLFEAGVNILQSIIDGIKSMFGAIVGTLEDVILKPVQTVVNKTTGMISKALFGEAQIQPVGQDQQGRMTALKNIHGEQYAGQIFTREQQQQQALGRELTTQERLSIAQQVKASGAAIPATMAQGVAENGKALAQGVAQSFESVTPMLPQSDAQEGPFSKLTLYGQRIIETIGAGVSGAGDALRLPVLAAFAGLALPQMATATELPGGMITPPFVAQENAPQRGATAFPRGAWEREEFYQSIQTLTKQLGQLAGIPQVAKSFDTFISNPMLGNAYSDIRIMPFGGYFAKGGDVSGDKAIIVGEKGPELFVPPGKGSIIPNNAFASDGYAGNTVSNSKSASFGDINITVNVQGGGNNLDPYALAQRIRDELRLAMDEANRRAMYDIA